MGKINTYPEASSAASDDYLLLDGSTEGTRKIKPSSLVDPTGTKSGMAADAKVVGDKIGDLNSAIGEGVESTLVGYWVESWNSQISVNLYKSNTIKIPANVLLETIRYNSTFSAASSNGFIFLVDDNNRVVDKFTITTSTQGWNTVNINKSYDVDVYIAVSGLGINSTYSLNSQTVEFSDGLYEAASTETTKNIGETITFSHVVPDRHYSFGVDSTYLEVGLSNRMDALSSRIDAFETVAEPSDFSTPRIVKTGEEGYSLFGKWYRMTDTYSQCANCGGASIAFKVKGATTVSVDIEQLIEGNNPTHVMAEEPYFAYSIDGGAFTRIQIETNGENSVKTINIPSIAEHFIWIVIDGMCQNSGIVARGTGWSGVYIKSLTSNGTMYKVKAEKQILYVGDSMVEGIDTLGTDSLSSSNSNVAEWSFKSAIKLHSFPLMQGYGGTTTWQGVSFELYSRPNYSGDTYIVNNSPDVIVCEYGHNDNTIINLGQKTKAEFIAQYKLLADTLEAHYPGVPIVFIIPFMQMLKDAITEVANDKDYYYLIQTEDYDYETTDGTHPSAASGTAMAEQFAEDMIKIFGKEFFL